MENILNNTALLFTIIGGLAVLVTIITEFTKKIGFLDKIPTDLQVLSVSILLSVLGIVVYIQYNNAKMIWYYIVGAIILGFVVGYVAMYGWEKFTEIFNRFKK